MSDRELVTSYLEGQIGRRAFIRRLVQTGVSLSAAVSYATVLGANPAGATHNGQPDFYEENRLIKVNYAGINPEVVNLLRGGLVQWDFDRGPGVYHRRRYTVSDPLGFIRLNENLLNEGHRAVRFFAAGTFRYRIRAQKRPNGNVAFEPPVTHHGRIQSRIRVSKAKVVKDAQVTVSWASKAAPDAFVYDVQIKRPGADSFVDWRNGVTDASVTFRPGRRGTYKFRARLVRVSNERTSDWSPGRLLDVV